MMKLYIGSLLSNGRGESNSCSHHAKLYRRRAMRRWSRLLAAIAILVVVTQLSMIGIAMVTLEEGNNSPSLVDLYGTEMIYSRDPHTSHNLRKQHHLDPLEDHPPTHEQRHHAMLQNQEQRLGLPSKQLQQQEHRELIHIVHTRFMQHQGNLTTLGIARLKQFISFCLPTMVHQTTQDFLWIIKVDPLLEDNAESNRKVLEPLLKAIQTHENDNIYVVGSNYNFNMEGHGGSWRDGQEGEELLLPLNNTYTTNSTHRANHLNEGSSEVSAQVKIYSGDMTRLKRAHDLREVLPVLETRLDADDGLNRNYLERVQTIALDRFVGPTQTGEDLEGRQTHEKPLQNDSALQAPPKPKWLYWCILTQIEWHSEIYSNANFNQNGNSSSSSSTTINTATTAQIGAENSSSSDYWELRNEDKIYYGNPSLGYVVPIANENFCITPGLTVGYGVGVTETSVPRYMHTSLFSALHDKFKFCYAKKDKAFTHKGPCLERMGGVHSSSTKQNTNGKTGYVIHALRSRTLTSAGMDGVGNSDFAMVGDNDTRLTIQNNSDTNLDAPIVGSTSADKAPENEQASMGKMETILWKVLQTNFGIDPSYVTQTQRFLTENRVQIALENSLGQCSMGHSCKDKARERLQKIVTRQNQSQTATL